MSTLILNLFGFRKETIRETVKAELRDMVLVLHKYQHVYTGMIISAYNNPSPALWKEIS